MKILIENTVPLNNGDAALVFSVGEKFEKLGSDVTYSSFNITAVKKRYPEKKWRKSLIDSKLIKIPFFGFIFLVLKLLLSREYREYDAVISAPGGYINSYYGFKRKIQLLSLYKILFKKKVYMYSQSIGPLNNKDEKILKRYVRYFDLFYVRDNISMNRMLELGPYENVVRTKDAAFLLDRIPSKGKKDKSVAISVREWKYDNRNEEIYIKLINKIVAFYAELDYDITFLSTCQGEQNYTNDAIMAYKIYEELPDAIKNKVKVDSDYYNLIQLREKLTEFDFVIGTRLHMCILSWLSGTPAFNISYEEKGKECYNYLDLDKFSIDYNYNGEIDSLLLEFTTNNNYINVFNKVNDIHEEAEMYFNKVYNNISLSNPKSN